MGTRRVKLENDLLGKLSDDSLSKHVKEEELLNNLIQEAIVEEDSLIDTNQHEVLGWLDWLEQLVEDDPPKFDVVSIPDRKLQKQSIRCNLCDKTFDFSINHGRHKWKHEDKSYEAEMKEKEAKFAEFWRKLEAEKTRNILSINNIVLPEPLQTLNAHDIIESVSCHLRNSGPIERRIILAASLLEAVHGSVSLSSKVLLQALREMSEGNFLHGTLRPEMQQIVCQHANKIDGTRAENLLALFGFLVEYNVVKAWNDDLEGLFGHMLIGKEKEEK